MINRLSSTLNECAEYLGGKRRIAAFAHAASVAYWSGEPPIPQPTALTKSACNELF